jgi:hypothetical protein
MKTTAGSPSGCPDTNCGSSAGTGRGCCGGTCTSAPAKDGEFAAPHWSVGIAVVGRFVRYQNATPVLRAAHRPGRMGPLVERERALFHSLLVFV